MHSGKQGTFDSKTNKKVDCFKKGGAFRRGMEWPIHIGSRPSLISASSWTRTIHSYVLYPEALSPCIKDLQRSFLLASMKDLALGKRCAAEPMSHFMSLSSFRIDGTGMI